MIHRTGPEPGTKVVEVPEAEPIRTLNRFGSRGLLRGVVVVPPEMNVTGARLHMHPLLFGVFVVAQALAQTPLTADGIFERSSS